MCHQEEALAVTGDGVAFVGQPAPNQALKAAETCTRPNMISFGAAPISTPGLMRCSRLLHFVDQALQSLDAVRLIKRDLDEIVDYTAL